MVEIARPQGSPKRSRRGMTAPTARRAAALVAVLAAAVALQAPAAAGAQSVKAAASKPWPIGGLVTLSSSAGIGTFVAGEQNRPSIGGSLNLLVNFRPMPGLTLMASQSINKTLVDYADDPFAPRSRNSSVDDLMIIASWQPMVKDDSPRVELTEAQKKAAAAAAATNPTLVTAGGAGKPLTLPGGINLSFLGLAQLPTGKASSFQGRYLALTAAANLTKSFSRFSFTYQARFQKQFHAYSAAVVTNDGGVPLAVGRSGGAENISDDVVATNQQNISWALRNALIANVSVSDNLSFQVFYFLLHQFRYYDAPLDELSSPYAKAGTRLMDLQYGAISANYVLPASLFASLSVATYSGVFTADNKWVRFPFFDFRSASDNITTVGLSLTRSF